MAISLMADVTISLRTSVCLWSSIANMFSKVNVSVISKITPVFSISSFQCLKVHPHQKSLCLLSLVMGLIIPSSTMGFPDGTDNKESACNAEVLDLIPGPARFLGEGHGNPLQDSCLENSMDRGAWRTTVHVKVAQSWERWGVTLNTDEALLARPLLTYCSAAWFLSGPGPVLVHGPGLGRPLI